MINYNHKDRLFTFLFGRSEHKEWILSLYNAINGSQYDNPDEIEITTIEDFVYMGRKNDVSFLLHDTLSLWEHQSTYNPNMPVRELMYIGELYDKYIHKNNLNIFGKSRIVLPIPKLLVFYNGMDNSEDEVILELKDSFPAGVKVESDISVRVRMLNINRGQNAKLMEACQPLNEYSWFIDKIRKNNAKYKDIETAVDKALEEMPDVFLIREILMQNRTEVKMLVLKYSEEDAIELFKEEGRKEGRRELIEGMLKDGKTPEDIAEFCRIPLHLIQEIQKEVQPTAAV